MSGGTNANKIQKAFDNYNIPATTYNINSSNAKETINKALREGRAVVANVNGGYYSPGGHFVSILGYDKDEKLIISNPCGSGLYGVAGYSVQGGITLDYFV